MSVDKESIFDYYVDESTKEWKLWEAEHWVAPKKIAFSQLLIPTGDSTRAEYIIKKIADLPLMRHLKRNEISQRNSLLVGGAGTAKTSGILMFANKFTEE
jgi:dynein heavy chain